MKKALQISLVATSLISNEISLNKVEIVAKQDNNATKYASSSKISRDKIDNMTSKNHTITELLRSNPSVTFGILSDNGLNSGEITPNDISINGAKFYQNNFLIDGINFNQDINPANKTLNGQDTPHYHVEMAASLSGQAMTLDTDLLQSVEVIDSSVSAKYGNFQGGVVNAKTRDPKREFSGVLSTQYTSGAWQKTFIHEDLKEYLATKSGIDKSDFSKRKFRFGVEGYVSENLGLLFDYTRFSSRIKYDIKSELINSQIAKIPDDKRLVENYFLKAIWNVNDRLNLRPSILYSMQKNRMFEESSLDSLMLYKYGGLSSNLAIDIDLDSVFLEQVFGYSVFHTSRYTDNKGARYDYKKSSVKNWGFEDVSTYGSVSDIKQNQRSFEYKLDAKFEEFNTFGLTHNILSGVEISRTSGLYQVLKPYEHYTDARPILNGYICPKDDKTCVNDDSFADEPGATGQFLASRTFYGNAKNKTNINQIAIYFEDEIKFNRFKIRPGLRVQKDNFSDEIMFAPRFVSEYEIFNKNFIGVGLNRYYGRNLFSYKIYNDLKKHRFIYERDNPQDSFTKQYPSHEINGDNELKTPHDDEMSLFYRGDIGNLRLNLKFIKRNSKNEVLTLNGAHIGKDPDTAYFANKGKSSAKIYTFTLANVAPFYILGTKNDFEFSISHTSKTSNFRDYSDKSLDKMVVYEGKLVSASELPVIDYIVPLGINLTHSVKFANFSVSNFIRYSDKMPVLWSKYNRDFKKTEYFKTELPSRTVWDMRIGYEQNLKDNFKFFANLDINNLLNKKYPLTASKRSFGAGRNFWLEVGLKW